MISTRFVRPLSRGGGRRFCSRGSLTLTKEVNGVKQITLNDPKRRNTLSLDMMKRLQEDLSSVNFKTDEIRVVTIDANGPVFSSGHNLKELTSKEGRSYHQHVFEECTKLNLMIRDLPVPVIAKVKGLAAAAGCQLVASCDVVVASREASFSTPGINFGLFCSTPGVSVGRSLPNKISMLMLLTGLPITAQEAYDHGLVSRLVDDVDGETERLVEALLSHSGPVVAMGKQCFHQQMKRDLPDAYRYAETVMLDNLALRDGQEGISSFIEKRKPVWSHEDE